MPSYATHSRFSLIQLHSEERKQRAHLNKITEMQRHSDLDNGAPPRFPYLNQNFLKQFNNKRDEITKENEVKSQKLLNIITSIPVHPPIPSHPTNQLRRNYSSNLSQSNNEYLGRIAKAKGVYDGHEWRKSFDRHREHLRIGKDNKVFTPLDIGINRQRVKGSSQSNSKLTTPTSSTFNIMHQFDKNNRL